MGLEKECESSDRVGWRSSGVEKAHPLSTRHRAARKLGPPFRPLSCRWLLEQSTPLSLALRIYLGGIRRLAFSDVLAYGFITNTLSALSLERPLLHQDDDVWC